MIPRSEIRKLAETWGVPPATVDKDYVLGHFLSAFYDHYGNELIFKGGTCLRKCYFPDYRFSEDLDFSSKNHNFVLDKSSLDDICDLAGKHSAILFKADGIKPLISKGIPKGFQVKIRYWGADHSRNEEPSPPERWSTKIKLEISTEEIMLLPAEERRLHHRYSDTCMGKEVISCYPIFEIISEKLRALVQRSYSAPRDIYDLYYLTQDFTANEWVKIKPLFLDKMKHKSLDYDGPDQLLDTIRMDIISKSWDASIAHQIDTSIFPKESIIKKVYDLLHTYM